jgi:hypothetical protein
MRPAVLAAVTARRRPELVQRAVQNLFLACPGRDTARSFSDIDIGMEIG